jgi:hypothetical protein
VILHESDRSVLAGSIELTRLAGKWQSMIAIPEPLPVNGNARPIFRPIYHIQRIIRRSSQSASTDGTLEQSAAVRGFKSLRAHQNKFHVI